MKDIFCVLLAGGEGKRLYPLTKYRSKPAVPLAGKYRLIDIPISNCLHAGFHRIFVLTQYSSESLNRHISTTYRFDHFSTGYVDILAAEQRLAQKRWYLGTADAVRHNIVHFESVRSEDVLVLSGDQLYRLDMQDFWKFHRRRDADITVAVKPVPVNESRKFGILRIDKRNKVTSFREKPALRGTKRNRMVLASMGIYIFKKKILMQLLKENQKMRDFGKHIIPAALKHCSVFAYEYNGFWEDVGTIKSFYNANMSLTQPNSDFNFYDAKTPIYTHPRFLPGSRLESVDIQNAVICDGCIIKKSSISNSIVGVRSIIGKDVKIENSLLMGADYYQSHSASKSRQDKVQDIGIGAKTTIKNAIVDKNARIGKNVVIENVKGRDNFEGRNFSIIDGIVVIEKNAVIEDGSII